MNGFPGSIRRWGYILNLLTGSQRTVIRQMGTRAALGLGNVGVAHWTPADEPPTPVDDNIYRVAVGKGSEGIEVVCLGIDAVDSALEGTYKSVNDLPDWVQEKLAALSVMSAKPPTTIVEGVGRRISENVYWVFAE